METKQKDTLNTPDSAENNHRLPYGDKLRTQENMEKQEPEETIYEALDNTPFILRKVDDKYFLTLGKYRITEPTNTKEETLEKLETEKWGIITQLAMITQEELSQITQEQRAQLMKPEA